MRSMADKLELADIRDLNNLVQSQESGEPRTTDKRAAFRDYLRLVTYWAVLIMLIYAGSVGNQFSKPQLPCQRA